MRVSCRLYVEVTDPEDLLTLDFDALPQPLFVMGGGSNLLFTRDFPGTVLHMANQGITLNPVISTKAEGRAEKSATCHFDRAKRAEKSPASSLPFPY